MNESLEAPVKIYLRTALIGGDHALVADLMKQTGPEAVAELVDEIIDLPPPATGAARHHCVCQQVTRTWQLALQQYQRDQRRVDHDTDR
ncbi:MAG: hypothetical protein II007_09495 [Gammaproteobacteria bacterium]|nr:hypothetical protein [Gammaproteobacteria bacterium]